MTASLFFSSTNDSGLVRKKRYAGWPDDHSKRRRLDPELLPHSRKEEEQQSMVPYYGGAHDEHQQHYHVVAFNPQALLPQQLAENVTCRAMVVWKKNNKTPAIPRPLPPVVSDDDTSISGVESIPESDDKMDLSE